MTDRKVINKNGIETQDIFYKFHNSFVRATESGINYYFEPTQEGQLDYMVYTTLLYTSNNDGQFDVRINKLVTSMGYTPKAGAGKINDKVKKSLVRLENKNLIEIDESEKTYVSGVVVLPEIDKRFFKLYEDNIKFILNDLNSRFNAEDEFISKYEDKAKAMYVYSYILSMMSKKAVASTEIKEYSPMLCFPTYDKICKECNVSRSYLNKLLAYFEYDGLIYTSNIGEIKDTYNETKNTAANYYTDDMKYLIDTYRYARGYYDLKSENLDNALELEDSRRSKSRLLNDIDNMMEKAQNKLSEDDYIKFREHTVLKIKSLIIDFEYADITKKNYLDNYIASRKYLTSIYNRKEGVRRNPMLLAIAAQEEGHIMLNTIANCIKALMYMYKVI